MNKWQPSFSVITVTFNAEKVLERTLQSIFLQTYPKVESVVIDGGSKDGTLNILHQHEEKIGTWVSEPDHGLYDAMNKGIQRAKGDYLIFLNAGDQFYDSETLQKAVDSLHGLKKLPDVIYGQTALMDERGKFLRMRRLEAPEHLTWKSFQQGMLVCHQAFWPKRSRAVNYDLSYRYSADQDWCIRIMKQSEYLYNTHQTLIRYLSEGITTRHRWPSLKERFRIMTKYYGFCSTLAFHAWFVLRAVLKK